MPNMFSTHMASKAYCPKCGSFNLKRLHRGRFKKLILNQPIQYRCIECKEQLSEHVIAENETKEVPTFIAN